MTPTGRASRRPSGRQAPVAAGHARTTPGALCHRCSARNICDKGRPSAPHTIRSCPEVPHRGAGSSVQGCLPRRLANNFVAASSDFAICLPRAAAVVCHNNTQRRALPRRVRFLPPLALGKRAFLIAGGSGGQLCWRDEETARGPLAVIRSAKVDGLHCAGRVLHTPTPHVRPASATAPAPRKYLNASIFSRANARGFRSTAITWKSLGQPTRNRPLRTW
jgi:hypothetical protein